MYRGRSVENFLCLKPVIHKRLLFYKRALNPSGIELQIGDHRDVNFDTPILGAIVQYPATDGAIYDYHQFAEQVHAASGLFVTATDLLALTLLCPPGEFGADIAIGSAQRFGVPLGYGGPHAAFLSTHEELKRSITGTDCRRIPRCKRQAGYSLGTPNARAAYPTRKSDE